MGIYPDLSLPFNMFNATYATRILNEFIHAILLIVDAVLTDVGSNQGPTFRAPRGCHMAMEAWKVGHGTMWDAP